MTQSTTARIGNTAGLAALFWSRVDRRADSECWPWRGCVYKGACLLRFAGRNHQAARLAYSLCRGPVARGDEVRRDCGTPLCVNPAHLSLACRRKLAARLSDEARRLAESCYRLAWKKALQVSDESGADPDDLLSEAMLILCQVAGWYDPDRGTPFAPVAGKLLTVKLRRLARKARVLTFTDVFGEEWLTNGKEIA